MGQAKYFLLAIVLMLSTIAMSDEQERQAAFRADFSLIVDSLNQGSYELLASAIDRNDFLARIFGLRLIDQRVKRDFTEQMKFQLSNLVKSGFSDSKDGFKAVLLGIESRGDRGRAVVRFDLPELQFSYHEYELRLDARNHVVVVDWTDYMQGERFTDGVGNSLVMAAPSKLAARKLIESKTVTDADMFQFGELLKAARDRDAERYVNIINRLTPELQRERIVVLTSVQLTKLGRSRRLVRTALVQLAKYYPSDPLYALMLLDYYVPTKKFDEALTALRATHAKLGFDDAAMEARFSAIRLALGNVEDASMHAERALELEPGLELAWWSALRARVAAENYPGAVAALEKLEQDYGHRLGRAELERDKSFEPLLASAEFSAWADERQ